MVRLHRFPPIIAQNQRTYTKKEFLHNLFCLQVIITMLERDLGILRSNYILFIQFIIIFTVEKVGVIRHAHIFLFLILALGF